MHTHLCPLKVDRHDLSILLTLSHWYHVVDLQVFWEFKKSSVVLASRGPLHLQDPDSCTQLAARGKLVGLMVVMSVLTVP